MFRRGLVILGSAIILVSPAATAAEAYAPTDDEVRPLPAFCRAHFRPAWKSFDPELVSPPSPGGKHLQHYCHALKFVIRSKRGRGADDRRDNLTRAKGEYGYVLRHESSDFWMRPQLYVELGRIERDLGAMPAAQKLFADAVAFNKKYEPAYSELIDSLQKSGDKSTALDVATQGLRNLPSSKRLQKAYLDLGGKMPFPEPLEATPPPSVSTQPAPAAETTTSEASEAAPDAAPTTGCRFCPPEQIQQRWRESFQGGE